MSHTDGETLYLAHPDAPLVIEPGAARRFDGHTLGVDLLWQCEHETAAAILDRLQGSEPLQLERVHEVDPLRDLVRREALA